LLCRRPAAVTSTELGGECALSPVDDMLVYENLVNPPIEEWVSMHDHFRPRATFRPTLALGATLLFLLPFLAGLATASPADLLGGHASGRLPLSVSGVQIQAFSFSPQTISSGSQTQGTIQLTGGTTPYHLWLNGTPTGCQPQSVPYVTSNLSTTFSCNPGSPGSYNIHLEVVDSSTPTATRASMTTSLQVNSNGNGNGNSNNNSHNSSGAGGLNLPGGLVSVLTIFAIVFLGAMVALAAGVIAVAVSVSRRLRQLTEAIAQQPKPPTTSDASKPTK
jgi:hypothetical protein